MALGLGGGLLGGAMLANAFDNHEDRMEEQAYDQGRRRNPEHDADELQGTTMVRIRTTAAESAFEALRCP